MADINDFIYLNQHPEAALSVINSGLVMMGGLDLQSTWSSPYLTYLTHDAIKWSNIGLGLGIPPLDSGSLGGWVSGPCDFSVSPW